ncbi:MAG: OsmC family protein [Pseudomonadota bacterium]
MDKLPAHQPEADVRARQSVLRSSYRLDPRRAEVTDLAWTCGEGDLASPMQGRVHFGSHAEAQLDYGVHGAIGGTHAAPVPGDLLCAALASCQESSLRMVAAVLEVRLLELRVNVRAKVDVRGTLGDPLVPVAFQSFELSVRLRAAPGTPQQRMRQLCRAAERSCVVLQTLKSGAPVAVLIDATADPGPSSDSTLETLNTPGATP